MKKRIALFSLFAVAVALLSFSTLSNKKLIVIDAGHGGHDKGATKEEVFEKDIVKKIAQKVFDLHDPSKVEIVLLRNTDDFVALTDRINAINELNPDLVISLHANFHENSGKSGIEAYVCENNANHSEAKQHAKKLLEALENDNLKSRGVRQANFMILRKSDCPSVLLELGFLSHENDLNYLTSEDGQNEIAKNILKSIQ